MQATRAATAALLLFVQNSTFPHSTVAPVLDITRNDEVRALSSGVPHSPTTRGGDQATPTATAGGWCSFRMAQVLETRPAVAPVLSHLVPHDDDHGPLRHRENAALTPCCQVKNILYKYRGKTPIATVRGIITRA